MQSHLKNYSVSHTFSRRIDAAITDLDDLTLSKLYEVSRSTKPGTSIINDLEDRKKNPDIMGFIQKIWDSLEDTADLTFDKAYYSLFQRSKEFNDLKWPYPPTLLGIRLRSETLARNKKNLVKPPDENVRKREQKYADKEAQKEEIQKEPQDVENNEEVIMQYTKTQNKNMDME